MNKQAYKIGVFDSGIGGLTVAKALKSEFPTIPIVYFGDTAHLPYGDKSKEAVISYCIKIGDFLVEKKCSHIVIACNTASAYGFKKLQSHLKGKAKVFNVIDPVVKYIASNYSKNKIGIIATKGTTKSRVYPRKIVAIDKSIKVFSSATPLLAPMIEEGFFNNNISRTIINNYLSKKELLQIDVLILACTHYPLIEKIIKAFYNNEVHVINSAKVLVLSLKSIFPKVSALKNKSDQFFVSDFTTSFQQSAKIFFGKSIKLTKKNIWK